MSPSDAADTGASTRRSSGAAAEAGEPCGRLPCRSLLGVVLAGGRSARMGRDKASLLHPSGATFLQFAVALLRPLCAEVAVSVGGAETGAASQCRGLRDVAILRDPVTDCGPAVGVATAVAAAARHSLAAALVIPVDMPALTAAHLTALIAAHQRSPDQLVAAVFGDPHAGSCEPLLAIYPAALADALLRLAASEDRSLSRWLRSRQVQRVVLPAAAAANVNTPAQLAGFQRQRPPQ